MEIHILLAGVEFGPYTDDKARELIADGFLSESDPAKRLDDSDWIPLSEVLAVPVTEITPDVPRAAEQFKEEIYGVSPPTSPALRKSSPLTTGPMTVPIPTRPAAREKIAVAPTSPLPSVSSAPPMLHVALPSRAKSKGGAAARTTGSLLAKEALDAARARVGTSPLAFQTTSLPTPPAHAPAEESAPAPDFEPMVASTTTLPASPVTPRPRAPIVLKDRETGALPSTKTSPRKPIRLTGTLSLTSAMPSVRPTQEITVRKKQTIKIPSDRETTPPAAPETPATSGPLSETPGTLTSSGDLAEKRSLKITGSLKQTSPRTPIRLTTRLPLTAGDSTSLPSVQGEESKTERPPSQPFTGGKKIWGPDAPLAKTPFTTAKIPVPEASPLETRPPSGKIPVSEMPPEGLKVRSTRRLPSKIPASEPPSEQPSETVDSSPSEETEAPPSDIAEASAAPPEIAAPEKIRLRRPVKLELSSRAKHDSGPITLETFSQMGSAESATSSSTPMSEALMDEVKASSSLSTELAQAAETVPLHKMEDFHPPRLNEVSGIDTSLFDSPKPRQPWVWVAYAIIAGGVIATFIILYLAMRPVAAPAGATSSPSGTSESSKTAPASSLTPKPAAAPAAPVTPSTPPAPALAKPDINEQVSAYVTDGMSSFQKGDLDSAMAAYNHALDLNPKSVDALYNRGITKAAQDDLDGAIADYSQALQIDPQKAQAYYNRGLTRNLKGDLDGAITDYNQAVKIDPRDAQSYFNRGLIRMQKDDIDGAIVDSSRALELDPHLIQSYYNRGLGRLAKGALDAALSDMKTFCTLAPQDSYTDYARLYIWLIRTQQSQLAEANQELSQAMASGWNGSADSMVTKIGEFLLGQISETDLIAASASPIPVKDQGQRCEAWYFIGMRRLEAGDKETAAADLRKCVETQKTDYCEYILAQEQLKTLNVGGTATSSVVTPPAAK